MSITKFLYDDSQENKIVERFNNLIKDKDNISIREIELSLLPPKPIPPYNVKKDKRKNSIQRKSLSLVFSNEKYLDLWEKFFKLSRSGNRNNSYDLEFIIKILELMDSGRIKFKEKQYYLVDNNGKEKLI